MTIKKPLFTTNKLRFAYHLDPILDEVDWEVEQSENWAVLGTNGSGKTTLARLLCGQLLPQKGSLQWHIEINPSQVLLISFDLQRELMDHDDRFDDSELRADAFDIGTTVKRVILQREPESSQFHALVKRFNIEHILDRGVRFISTGEGRKTLLARALMQHPKVLILDAPLEGLDAASQREFGGIINELIDSDLNVIVLANRSSDLPSRVTHFLHLEEGRATSGGQAAAESEPPGRAIQTIELPPPAERNYPTDRSKPLLELDGVSVSFFDSPVLQNIEWKMDWGQHTCISGPNGSGKSTLLNLLTGENHKAYGQPVSLFGRPRGSGETVWEIKQRFAPVSTQLQLKQPGRTSAADVIASGLHDTVGLYRNCSDTEKRLVKQWLAVIEMSDRAATEFKELSFGEQRLVLVARAMVKSPLILILDEPCIGLDQEHRQRILQLADLIAEQGETHLIYVSHVAAERPRSINQQLHLTPHPNGGYTGTAEAR